MTHTLGIIGAGNMGEAIIRGAVRAGVLEPGSMLVAEPDDARRAAMADLGLAVTTEARDTIGCEQLLLAVKPQTFPAIVEAIGPLPERTVVISVMAGLTSGPMRAGLGPNARIIRVMPNTPCQIGLGVSGIAPGEGAEPGDDALARRLMSAIGEIVTVQEKDIYAVTGVSGSGPAYVFRLAEAMEAAAQSVGLSADVAKTLVRQTIRGAGALLMESDRTPAELREAVTSKGGTTAAGLEQMNERDIDAMMNAAITAARDRGVELDG